MMLRLKNVTKVYSNKTVLEHINLHVSQGEIVGLLGPNGSGKTTMIKIITGIEKPDNGNVIIYGNSILSNPVSAKQHMSYIADVPYLYGLLTGEEYLHFMADMWNVDRNTKKKNIEKYLQLLDLHDISNEVIGNYSLGTKQKIALAGALVHEPKLLIMDEPFTGIDIPTSKDIEKILKSFADAGGAVFLSTHQMDIVRRMCTKITVLLHGKIAMNRETSIVEELQSESIEELFYNSKKPLLTEI